MIKIKKNIDKGEEKKKGLSGVCLLFEAYKVSRAVASPLVGDWLIK